MKKLVSSRIFRLTLFGFSSLSLISWDRISKDMAKEQLKDKASYTYFHDSFRLFYIENTGAAMSMGDNISPTASFWLLSIVPLCGLLGLLVYIIRKSNDISYKKLCIFSLIFAGGMGNIIDRILFDRHVTDFMNIGIGNIRTGIFNFADVWITAGMICLLFLGRQEKGTKQLTS